MLFGFLIFDTHCIRRLCEKVEIHLDRPDWHKFCYGPIVLGGECTDISNLRSTCSWDGNVLNVWFDVCTSVQEAQLRASERSCFCVLCIDNRHNWTVAWILLRMGLSFELEIRARRFSRRLGSADRGVITLQVFFTQEYSVMMSQSSSFLLHDFALS